jgi:hypothetical protein
MKVKISRLEGEWYRLRRVLVIVYDKKGEPVNHGRVFGFPLLGLKSRLLRRIKRLKKQTEIMLACEKDS